MSKEKSRLLAMVCDNGQTWDLSINDKKSIQWALSRIEDLSAALYAYLDAGHKESRRLASIKAKIALARVRGE